MGFGVAEFAFELERRSTEVDKEADVEASGNEVVHGLNLVDLVQCLYRLQLHNDAVLDQDVGGEVSDRLSVVENRNAPVVFYRQPRPAQLEQQRPPVDRLQEPRPQNPMHLHRQPNDLSVNASSIISDISLNHVNIVYISPD